MMRRIYGFIYCACFLSWYNDKSIEHPYLYTYEEASWVLSLYLLAPNVVTALGKVHKSHFYSFLNSFTRALLAFNVEANDFD